MMITITCPICKSKLELNNKSYKCSNGHCFDVAKKGYVNLLTTSQGNKFVEEGDKKESIESRTKFLDKGFYSVLSKYLIRLIKNLNPEIILDVGCGEGYYTTLIAKENPNASIAGLDISKSGINYCCTRKNVEQIKNISYFIGNIDYLPFSNDSIDLLLNCFGPFNKNEFVRVLAKDGYYIRVLPSTYHLFEFKNVLYEEVKLNEPKSDEIEGLTLVKKEEINDSITLSKDDISNLLKMTPYAYKTKKESINQLLSLDSLTTKISFLVLLYKK